MIHKPRWRSGAAATWCAWGQAGLLLLSAMALTWWWGPGHAEAQLASSPPLPIVKSIEVRGNRRVERDTILFHVSSKVGERFSVTTIRNDLRKIYGLRFFKDVRVETEDFEGGLKIIFVVEEQPTIRGIHFKGNKNIDEEKLRERLKVSKRAVMNRQLLQESITDMKKLYEEEGYIFAEISSAVEKVNDSDVDVSFTIDEGMKLKVTSITFSGNEHLSSRLLRKRMILKEKSLLSVITGSGKFRRDALNVDRLRLKAAYEDYGYIQAQVGDAKVDYNREKREIHIHYDVVEGPEYRVGTVEVQGQEPYSTEQLLAPLTLKPGRVFSRSQLRKDIITLTNLYAVVGYAYTDVQPLVKQDHQERLVNLTYTIERGIVVNIGRILLRGNHRTRDHVIRREIPFAEGDLYNGKLLQTAQQRIRGLGYFDQVEINNQPTEKREVLDIVTRVQEQSTGSISGGVGFSSTENVLFSAAISERNFLGKGQSVSLRGSRSSIRQSLVFSFAEPYLWGRDVSFNFDLFAREDEFNTFTVDTTGGNVRLGRRVWKNLRASMGYRYEDTSISEVDSDAPALARRQAEKDFTISAISPALSWDSRDNRLAPTRGTYDRISAETSGPLGGTHFYKLSGESRWFFPILNAGEPKKAVVLMLRGRGSYARPTNGDELPVFERYFLGGNDNLRGFKFREAGPKDDNDEPFGGTSELLFSSEVRFPIPRIPVIGGLLFVDAGNVFCDDDDLKRSGERICGGKALDFGDLRYSAGGGVRFDSPLGTVQLEMGWKLDKRDGEDASEIHFKFGRGF